MGITANPGPLISFGYTTTSSGGVQEYNEQAGPDLSYLGNATMDPRPAFNYMPGDAVTTRVYGLYAGRGFVDAVPSQSFSSGPTNSRPYAPGTIISCLAGSTLLTALTLNTTVSSATGQWLSQSYPNPNSSAQRNGTQTVNMVTDYATPYLTFGSAGTVALWNPANGIARAIAITGSSSGANDASVTASIAGIDLYGYKQSETLTLGSSSLNGVISRKCFKGINTITLNNSSLLGSTVINVAFADKFEFPTLVNSDVNVTLTQVTSDGLVTTYVPGSSLGVVIGSTATATATTSDPRGSWTSTAASIVWSGSNRLKMVTEFNPVSLASVTATDFSLMFGATTYST